MQGESQLEKTPDDVARWMIEQLRANDVLYQQVAAAEIQRKFGDIFVYINENGNLAISKAVLKGFRRLTGENAVWVRSEKLWRLRESYDDVDRRMQD